MDMATFEKESALNRKAYEQLTTGELDYLLAKKENPVT